MEKLAPFIIHAISACSFYLLWRYLGYKLIKKYIIKDDSINFYAYLKLLVILFVLPFFAGDIFNNVFDFSAANKSMIYVLLIHLLNYWMFIELLKKRGIKPKNIFKF